MGGYACLQPEVEGVYVPLVDELIDQETLLYEYFIGPKWHGWCSNEIDSEDADIIDEILNRSFHTRLLKVDRSQFRSSFEAWIYVTIATQPDEQPIHYDSSTGIGVTASGNTILDSDYERGTLFYPFYGFGQTTGILTWSNSD